MRMFKRQKRGMTLVELIISTAVGTIVIAAACTVLYFGYSNYMSGTTDLANHQNANLLETYLQHDLATATAVTVTTGHTQSQVLSSDSIQSADDTIVSMHFNSDKILVINEKGGTSVNLAGVEKITLTAENVSDTSSSSSASSTPASANGIRLNYRIEASDPQQSSALKRSFVLTGGVVLNNISKDSQVVLSASPPNKVELACDTPDVYFNIQMPKSSVSSAASAA